MDTTVVAHFRDQWDHFRAGEVWERVRKEIAKLTFEMVAWKLDDKITPV